MKFCRRFERFAANLIGCLSVKEYWFEYLGTRVTEGKFANQRPFKTASKISGLDPLSYYFVFLIYNERLPFKLHLVVFLMHLKIALWMCAHRTYFRCLRSNYDMSAITAFPYLHFTLFKHL